MTASRKRTAGAPSGRVEDWNSIDWSQARRDVRRLQVRIAKAVKEGKHGKVKALQWILTHSYFAKLLAVKRGTPKHKKLMKLFADDPGLQTLVNKVEADYMREKRLHDVDEMLYFAMDEKGHNVHLSDRGQDEMSPGDAEAFTIPDLSAAMGEIEDDQTLSVDEKREKLAALCVTL